tara:strand:- start:3729 stop:4820 length:1092 start_codon:yes stop_codon:yes gene_type:complete
LLYLFLSSLIEEYSFLNIVRYLSFRSVAAFITSLIIVFIFSPKIINWLKSKQNEGQPIRLDGPKWHLEIKRGTPTMGGVIILGALVLSSVLWADINNVYIWIVLYITFAFGAIGFFDDYLKVSKNNHRGLSGKIKIFFQLLIVTLASIWIYSISPENVRGVIAFPFVKDSFIYLNIFFYCIFACLVVVGSSNAVNLTDGLDGLAIVPIIIAISVFGLIAYLVGNVIFSNYLNLHYIEGSGELVIFCASLAGAGIGFLWYNAPPASVFMGDTGSLSAGAALGVISIIIKHEIVLAIVGGLFVLEAVSVIVQVFSFKLTGKRIFRMAPLHHHFEKKGWSESTVVIRFWIIAVILALIGLATLKLR